MEAILEQLARSPKLKLYINELTQILTREAPARMHFRHRAEHEELKAEFVNGEVVEFMATRKIHAKIVQLIQRLVSTYVDLHSLGVVASEQALTEFTRNDYEPDICYWSASKSASFSDAMLLHPIPDFIVEVLSPSTESRDRGLKFEDYAAHGVREYWIVDPDASSIEQYILKSDRYELVSKFTSGTLTCHAIPGLQFPVAAAFNDQANLAALFALRPD